MANWFQQQRQEWIAQTIRVVGYINRADLQHQFGISRPQASIDLTTFRRRNPQAMTYNPSAKRYERTDRKTGRK